VKKIFLILLFFQAGEVFSQSQNENVSYFGKTLEIGSSLTYIWDDNNRPPGDFLYSELTWNVNVKMKLHKRVWLGAQIAPIFTRTRNFSTVSKENYNLFGIMTQFDFVSKKEVQLFGEVSLNRSNFLNQYFSNPTKMEGLSYFGFGGGGNILINKKFKQNLFLEISFFNYYLLNDIPNKSNYTQYIVGLNYRLGKK